ncbi:hypothetical protein LSTR_LSTR003546 [Laodelphax striatellus]|uniref:TRAF1-6 MATH domain-containing protein n=1 Tax=Laodelphax striatellus TaxID=195883 RepID=A0A482WLM6_LAOST|nr:hypothetical protein LSTR_LSTR003546 [Laodelphax striatellus]
MSYHHSLILIKVFLSILVSVECDDIIKIQSEPDPSASDEVLETQHTICRIDTQEIAATAQATVTRALKGMCAAKNMEEHFKKIENMLKEQLDKIKIMEDQLYSSHKNKLIFSPLLNSGAIMHADRPTTLEMLTTKTPNSGLTTIPPTTIRNNVDDKQDSELLKPKQQSPRDREVKRYNGTVHKEPGSKVFTYYWRLTDAEDKLKSAEPTRSRSFYVTPGGYCLYMKLMPKQNGDTVYIHVGVTKGKFDEALLWPFRLKLRLHVLNQETGDRRNDLVSKIWDPSTLCTQVHWQKPRAADNHECLGLGVPSAVLEKNFFIFQNLMIIKLSVFL